MVGNDAHTDMTPEIESPAPRRFLVAGWLVEAELNRISRDGATVVMEPKVIEVLCCLAARPGTVVSRDELLRMVWLGRPVVDQVLTRAVGQLRAALGDEPNNPAVIETIAKRGYRLLLPVEAVPDQSSADGAGRRRTRTMASLAAGIMILAVVLAASWTFWPLEKTPLLPVRAVTVLPFQMLSTMTPEAQIRAGMVEILTSDLSRIEGLRVIARDSVATGGLDDLTLEQIGARLGVDAVVQGSIHGDNEGLRVDLRLVRTGDGQVIWSDTVRGGSDNLLSLHERVSAAATAALHGEPLPTRGPTATVSREAYEEYLFGRHHWNRRTVDGLNRAIAHFETALELDPAYAQAQAALAQTYVLLPYYGVATPHESMPRARTATERALELDPGLAKAYAVLGQVLHEYDWNADGAETAFRRAIALDPDDSTTRQWYAEFLLVRERIEESRQQIEIALQLDPLSPIVRLLPVGPELWEARYEEAAAAARHALEIDPRFAQGQNLLGISYLWAQQPEKAISAFETALPELGIGFVGPRLGAAYASLGLSERAGDLLEDILAEARRRYVSPFMIATLYHALGSEEDALAWLETAHMERDGQLLHLNLDRRWDILRDNVRFQAVYDDLGLPSTR